MLNGKFPRIATMWLDGMADGEGEIEALARHTVVVLSMSCMGYHPTLPAQLRAINPDITIFGFIPFTNTLNWYPYTDWEGHPQGGAGNYGPGDHGRLCPDYALSSVCAANDWFLRVAPTGTQEKGNILNYWGNGLSILNLTDECPLGTVGDAAGLRLNEWLPGFWASLKEWPQWDFDGYYFDNVWDGIHTTGGNLVDINQDGVADPVAAALSFYNGVQKAMAGTRALLPNDIIWGNAAITKHQGCAPYMNGIWYEGIGTMLVDGDHMAHDWGNRYNTHWYKAVLHTDRNDAYLEHVPTYGHYPHVSGINMALEMPANNRLALDYDTARIYAADNNHYQVDGVAHLDRNNRLWIATCALGDGYFFAGNANDGNTAAWWIEPYYSMDWGQAIGPYYIYQRSGKPVYRRDFERGIVIVNPSPVIIPAEGDIPAIPAWDAFIACDRYIGFIKQLRPVRTLPRRGVRNKHQV